MINTTTIKTTRPTTVRYYTGADLTNQTHTGQLAKGEIAYHGAVSDVRETELGMVAYVFADFWMVLDPADVKVS